MTEALKRKQVRVYLDAEREKQFAKLVQNVKLFGESALMTAMVSAALDAAAANGFRLPMPFVFKIEEPEDSEQQTRAEERPKTHYRK